MEQVQNLAMQNPAKDEIDVVVIGPGFGECILIHIGAGEWIVIDSCVDSSSERPAAIVYLEKIGVDPSQAVKLVCASHWHDDHVGAMAELVGACTAADFACSAALSRSEFVELASVLNRNLSLIQPAGPTEIYNVLNILEQRRQVPLRVVANLPFFRRPELSCVVTALSPSNTEFDRFLRSATALYPPLTTSKSLRVPDPKPNDLSVAMWVTIGDVHILLGADVEEHGDSHRGWSAILASKADRTRARLFKIAHHGSITGHHDDIWGIMLESNPHAVLTPWNRGSKLPTAADRDRIMSFTGHAFATSRPVSAREKKKGSAVDRTLTEANITIQDLEPPTGFVHFCMKPGGPTWNVTLSPEALTLDKYVA